VEAQAWADGDPSLWADHPFGTVASSGSTDGNAVFSSRWEPANRRQDSATSGHPIGQEIGAPMTGLKVQQP
jgi:hypothetical protein